MDRSLLESTLVEDLNRLACAEDQARLAADPARARQELDRLRWIDTTELARFRSEGRLDRRELDLIEQFTRFAQERLGPIPSEADPVGFTLSDPGWQVVRERAVELLSALDAFIDIGVPGWAHQYQAGEPR